MSVHILGNDSAYLETANAAVFTMPEPKALFVKPEVDPKEFQINNTGTTYKGVVYWGEKNTLPMDLVGKVYGQPIVSAAMEFKSLLTFGGGVVICKKDKDGKLIPTDEFKEINAFLEENDINGHLLEQATDLTVFYNIFPEIICNQETRPKVVELNHLEACFSRWEKMNDKGVIEHHFYSALWGEEDNPKDMVATPVLNPKNPIKDLKYKLGIEADPLNKIKPVKDRRFVIPVRFPTPGRFYYSKPYWVSIIESGWYDFAAKIPEFKRALLNNGMVIKYHITILDRFWDDLYKDKGATTDKAKLEAKTTFLTQLNEFLSKPENAGKQFVSKRYMSVDGKIELEAVKITPVKNEYTGGEYLGDLEEVSNILSYGMGVHPSLIGAAPGKNKTINGTEARELFIIKQSMLAPFRDRLLFPLYLVKAINGWPAEAHFTIPNLELTTLDNGTGAKKTISQPAIDNAE